MGRDGGQDVYASTVVSVCVKPYWSLPDWFGSVAVTNVPQAWSSAEIRAGPVPTSMAVRSPMMAAIHVMALLVITGKPNFRVRQRGDEAVPAGFRGLRQVGVCGRDTDVSGLEFDGDQGVSVADDGGDPVDGGGGHHGKAECTHGVVRQVSEDLGGQHIAGDGVDGAVIGDGLGVTGH